MPRTPGENSTVVKSLGLSVGRIYKMRVGRAEITSELVQSVASDEHAWRNIEYAIVRVELVNGCTAAGGITLAEDRFARSSLTHHRIEDDMDGNQLGLRSTNI
jgi:hypothetical protein